MATEKTVRKWDPSLKTHRIVWGKKERDAEMQSTYIVAPWGAGVIISLAHSTPEKDSVSSQVRSKNYTLMDIFIGCSFHVTISSPTSSAVQLPAIILITHTPCKKQCGYYEARGGESISLTTEWLTQYEYELSASWGDFKDPGPYWQIGSLKPPSGWRWTWHLWVPELHLRAMKSFQTPSMKRKGL